MAITRFTTATPRRRVSFLSAIMNCGPPSAIIALTGNSGPTAMSTRWILPLSLIHLTPQPSIACKRSPVTRMPLRSAVMSTIGLVCALTQRSRSSPSI